MQSQDFSLSLSFDASPEVVYAAILDTRSWWSGQIEGSTDTLGRDFRYRYGQLHDSTQQVRELLPGRRVVWHVTEAHLSFTPDPAEWRGTDIEFELQAEGASTRLHFRHVGLSPRFDCFQACSSGWTALLTKNLRERVASGEAQPDAFGLGGA